ncbi:MFS transporter, partial [Listeria welshimeri]|uniref:MFS transporter n=1 Tax=Listeria welshimeri TaxID=1643 RepID=UPI001E2F8343
MTKSAISKLTKKLIEKGFVESYQKPENKKEIYFRLTKKGAEINQVHDSLHQEFLERDKIIFDEVTDDQYEEVLQFLAKYSRHLDIEMKKVFVPFLVAPYVSNSSEQALMVTLLTSVYAFCVFFAAPGLGALSDRFGRRPILLICFIGSALGYFIFGLGGALWVLFLGRMIEGITGGSIS